MPKRVQLIISLLVIASGGGFWFLVDGTTITSLGFLPLFAIVDLAFFFAFLGLSFIFLRPRIAAFNVLISFLPVLFFLENKFLALGIILFSSFFTIFPARRIQIELSERLIFSIYDIIHKGLPTLLTVLALALAAFFYPNQDQRRFEDVIPENFFQKVMVASNKLLPLQKIFPFEIPDPNKTVDEVIMDSLRKEGGDTFFRLSKAEQEDVLREARKELSRNLKTETLPGDAKVGSFLYKSSIDVMEERFGAYKKYLPAVFVFTVFAALRTLFIFLGWTSIAISWIVYRILLYTGMIKLSKRQITQEFIEYN